MKRDDNEKRIVRFRTMIIFIIIILIGAGCIYFNGTYQKKTLKEGFKERIYALKDSLNEEKQRADEWSASYYELKDTISERDVLVQQLRDTIAERDTLVQQLLAPKKINIERKNVAIGGKKKSAADYVKRK
jgi:hypothetical protein